MPSAKILSEKQAYVAALKEKIAASVAGVVVDYKGINVPMIPSCVRSCVRLALSMRL